MKTLVLFSLIITLSLTSSAQYSVRQYFNDFEHFRIADSLAQQAEFESAKDILSKYRGAYYGGTHFLRAKINHGLGKPYMEDLDSTFIKGILPQFIDSTAEVFVANATLIDSLSKVDFTPTEVKNLRRVLAQIRERDNWQNREGDQTQQKKYDLDNRRRLDSIIAEIGWPSRMMYDPFKPGPANVLVHQGNLTLDEWEHYFKLVADLALKKRESWNVVETILGFRFQYYSSDLRGPIEFPDTIVLELNEDGQIDTTYSLAYLFAMSRNLCNASQNKLRYSVHNAALAEQIESAVYEFEKVEMPPPEIVEMLKMQGFDMPGPITPERIKRTIDPSMKPNEMAFKFVH